MALSYSDITVEIKEIFLKNRPQELYDISPKGTVPVLCLSKSIIIEESLDDTIDVFETLNKAEQELFNVTEGTLRKSYDSMSDLIKVSGKGFFMKNE